MKKPLVLCRAVNGHAPILRIYSQGVLNQVPTLRCQYVFLACSFCSWKSHDVIVWNSQAMKSGPAFIIFSRAVDIRLAADACGSYVCGHPTLLHRKKKHHEWGPIV